MLMYKDEKKTQPQSSGPGLFSGLSSFVGSTINSVTSFLTTTTTSTTRRPPSPVLKLYWDYQRQIAFDIMNRQLEEKLTEMNSLLTIACEASPTPGSPDDDENRKKILLKIIEILIEIGCLVPSPVQPFFQVAAYGYGALKLSEQTGNMIKRVKNGEKILEFNQQNVTEWLEIVSSSAGLSSTLSTDIIVKHVRNGETKEALEFIATVLDNTSLGCDSGSIAIQRFGDEYNKMTPVEQRSEDISLIIHFNQLFAALV
jgi:hypothetical protein